MSVHSNGGQLFWQPGAYIEEGRVTTPRPPLGHESFYWQSADRILSQVKAHRKTVVTPQNVGGSADVLYFVGRQRPRGPVLQLRHLRVRLGGRRLGLQPGDRRVRQGGSFQPTWVGNPELISGHSETHGVLQRRDGDVPDRRDWGRDKTGATSTLTPGNGTQSDSPIGVRFDTNEPATVYYTTDGSRPDAAVAALQPDRVPGAGGDPVGREDHDVQVVLGRRRRQRREQLRPGQPGDAGQLPHRHDQHRREPERRRATVPGDAQPVARRARRRSARSRRASARTTRRRRRPT